MGRLIAIVLAALALAGCGHDAITRVEYRPVPYPVPAPCPDQETKQKLDEARPVPLREQEPYTSEAERIQREREQLRRYEGRDEWADQAQAALDDCASRGPLVVEDGPE